MLTTLENAKAWMIVPNATDDALITRLIESASAYMESYINRSFAVQSYTDVRDGTGRALMPLGDYPVVSVQGVVVNGRAIPPAVGWGVAGYALKGNSVLLTGYTFERGTMNVQVDYTAGYAQTPKDIEQACLELVALRYKERERIGHQSKSLAGETVSFFIGDMPASVKTILNQYKKVAPL